MPEPFVNSHKMRAQDDWRQQTGEDSGVAACKYRAAIAQFSSLWPNRSIVVVLDGASRFPSEGMTFQTAADLEPYVAIAANA